MVSPASKDGGQTVDLSTPAPGASWAPPWTPGPWGVREQTVRATAYRFEAANVAWVYDTTKMPPGAARANTLLIAAAPDLYEALVALHAACELRANQEGGDFGPDIGPAAELAKAALLKATEGAGG